MKCRCTTGEDDAAWSYLLGGTAISDSVLRGKERMLLLAAALLAAAELKGRRRKEPGEELLRWWSGWLGSWGEGLSGGRQVWREGLKPRPVLLRRTVRTSRRGWGASRARKLCG